MGSKWNTPNPGVHQTKVSMYTPPSSDCGPVRYQPSLSWKNGHAGGREVSKTTGTKRGVYEYHTGCIGIHWTIHRMKVWIKLFPYTHTPAWISLYCPVWYSYTPDKSDYPPDRTIQHLEPKVTNGGWVVAMLLTLTLLRRLSPFFAVFAVNARTAIT